MANIVRAALVQAAWTGDQESMITKSIDLAKKAAKDGAKVLCFQELFYGPYFCQVQENEHFDYAEPIPDGPTTKRMQKLAKDTGMVLIVPMFEMEQEGFEHPALRVEASQGAWILDQEARRLLAEAMPKLPPRQKQALTLKLQNDWKYERIAQEMGIKVTETLRAEPFDYLNLITVRVATTEQTDTVSGTLFGKIYPRVVEINDFRVDISPSGHMLIILSENKPGVIGRIGATFGEGGVNIVRIMVGNEEIAGQKNMVIIKTDDRVPAHILETLKSQKVIFSATPVNF